MKEDGLLRDKNWESSLQTEKLKEYCRTHIESALYKEAVAMVGKLDGIVTEYQLRYNLVGSVHKTFCMQADSQKKYQYLSAERMILSFTGKNCRFMDWLLSHRQYMNFLSLLHKYWNELRAGQTYAQALEQLVETVSERIRTSV